MSKRPIKRKRVSNVTLQGGADDCGFRAKVWGRRWIAVPMTHDKRATADLAYTGQITGRTASCRRE